MSLRLDWCNHEAAKYAVEHWHYSRSVPNQKLVRIGVWEEGVFRGCVLFGDGANGQMFRPYGLGYEQGCELVRIALRSHTATVSRIVGISLRLLRRHCPGLRLVVSFADPEHSHVGAIYQAGNWVYTGLTAAADEYIVKGVRMHGRALRSTRSTHRQANRSAPNVLEWTRKVIDPAARIVPGSSKHRYLMPLDDAMRKQIAPLAQAYPKRERSADSGTPVYQTGGGGANPTRSLVEA